MRTDRSSDNQHHTTGDGVTKTHQGDGRERFQRDADAQVSGSPENTYGRQSEVGLKLWMISQAFVVPQFA